MTDRLAALVCRRPLQAMIAAVGATATVIVGTAAIAQGVAAGFRSQATPSQRLDAAVTQLRIGACAPVFQQAGSFLFENAPANFIVQPLGPDTNRWPTVVTIEGDHPPSAQRKLPQTRLTTLIVAPAGTCSGFYNQVIYWPEPCAAVKARVFPTFANEHPLLSRVKVSEASAGLQLFLMPAGAGCVSVKKELIG